MGITDIRDEEALDTLADIIEPAAEIFQDKELVDLIRSGNKVKAISVGIKGHKKSIMEILAALERVPVEEYHCGILTMPAKLLEILNSKAFSEVFISQGQKLVSTFSGSATESTGAKKK